MVRVWIELITVKCSLPYTEIIRKQRFYKMANTVLIQKLLDHWNLLFSLLPPAKALDNIQAQIGYLVIVSLRQTSSQSYTFLNGDMRDKESHCDKSIIRIIVV